MSSHQNVPTLRAGAAFAGPEFAGCINSGRRPVIKVPACRKGDGPGRLESLGWIIVGDEVEAMTGFWDRSDFDWFLGPKRGKHPTRRLWKFRGRSGAVSKFEELCDRVVGFNDGVRSERASLRKQAAEAVAAGDAGALVGASLGLADLR